MDIERLLSNNCILYKPLINELKKTLKLHMTLKRPFAISEKLEGALMATCFNQGLPTKDATSTTTVESLFIQSFFNKFCGLH